VPLFFFHLVADQSTFLDEDGIRFADSDTALGHAKELIAGLASKLPTQNGAIVIENDDDGGLFEVRLGPS
jgi:hypothetical protein